MLILLNSTKTMDFARPIPETPTTHPRFLDQARILINRLRPLEPDQLSQLMHMSLPLGAHTHAGFQSWGGPEATGRTALFAFRGTMFEALSPETLPAGLLFAEGTGKDARGVQDRLRILSGLYGVLRPLDRIEPYRLEMGLALNVNGATSVVGFWDGRLSASVLADAGDGPLLNLASQEYVKAIQPTRFRGRLITPVFNTEKNGKLRSVAVHAKRARGLMARHALTTDARTPEDLFGFAMDGYAYRADLSTPRRPVFTRTAD